MGKKAHLSWIQCENCSINLLIKDKDKHLNDCPPNEKEYHYGYIKDEILIGQLNIKTNVETNGLENPDFFVYLSQSAIQLCSLEIGEWVIIQFTNDLPSIAKIVWPTIEKTLTSILLTENGLELTTNTINSLAKIKKLPINHIKEALYVYLILLNGSKNIKLDSELLNKLKKSYLEKIVCVGNRISYFYYGIYLHFEIKLIVDNNENNLNDEINNLTLDDKFYKIINNTQFLSYRETLGLFEGNSPQIDPLTRIGGLNNQINELNELINIYFNDNNNNNFLKIRSVLLYGNPGTGKTLLANAVASKNKKYIVNISPAIIYKKNSKDPELSLNELFDEALENSPTILILDEIDNIGPTRVRRITETEKSLLYTLQLQLDNLNKYTNNKIFIIATSVNPDLIDLSLRRCGRIDCEIEISTTLNDRRLILNKIIDNIDPNILDEITLNTHGFVGSDLLSLCQKAQYNCQKIKGNNQIDLNDFKVALKQVVPSAMKEVQIEVPNVKWDDIGGQENIKLILKQCIEWPLHHPESFTRLGITPPRGVLMFGPPGCSKTMIAKALATESGLNFLSIKGPELFSKWVGESERAVRDVFKKARQVAPSIIFFDEIDALGGERSSNGSHKVQERVVAQLLTELDGITSLGDVTILAATNRPDMIDKALLRPGRLDRLVYVSLPDENTRRAIFNIKLKKMPVKELDLDLLVKSTKGYSGAEIVAVCHEAAMIALEEDLNISFVNNQHFLKALQLVRPRTSSTLINYYRDYIEKC